MADPTVGSGAAKKRASLQYDTLEKAGLLCFVIGNMFAADELVPGWGFHLGLSHRALYLIAVASGAIGGAMIIHRRPLAGIVGGAIAGLGALATVSWYLAQVNVSHSAIMALLGMIGAIPGILVGFGVKKLQDAVSRGGAGATPP